MKHFFFFIFSFSIFFIPISATDYYVKTTGKASNSGLSWAESTILDKAIKISESGDVIHIAAGIYHPTRTIEGGNSADVRDRTFEISKNISLIGGYPANASAGSVSNPNLYETIFDGDITNALEVPEETIEEKLLNYTNLIKSIIQSQSYEIIDGIQTTEIAYIDKESNLPMRIYVTEVDLAEPSLSVEVSTPNNQPAYGFQTIREQAKLVDSNGHKVWCGINGDFFDTSTGEPQGIVYKNSVAIKETFYDNNNTYFAITKDGKALIGDKNMYSDVKSTIKEAIGGRTKLVWNGSNVSTTGSAKEPRTAIGVSIDGKKVYILVVDGRKADFSNGMKLSELAECMMAFGADRAINFDGGGSTTFFVRNNPNFTTNRFELKNQPRNVDEGKIVERAVANGLLMISNK
jgi:hypothetical protein